MTRLTDIASLADDLVGTPFVHQGRTSAGTDCIGAVYGIGQAGDVDLRGYKDNPTYGRDPDGQLESLIDKYLKRIVPMPTTPRPGQLLFFKFGRKAQHLGIMSNTPEFFIHAHEPEGRVVRTRLDRRWRRFLVGVYEFYGIEA